MNLLHLRPGTPDIAVFREVWLDKRYDAPCPVRPKLILDCGANIGLTSRWLHERYPAATVLSVEPHPENWWLCDKNNPDAVVIQGAIGGEFGRTTLWMPQGEKGFNACTISRDGGIEVGTVPVYTIDGILAGRTADIVKMDIEGSEKSVFEAECLWLNTVSLLMVEQHDRFVPGCQDAMWRAVKATGRPYRTQKLGGPNVAITFEDK